MSSIRLKGRSNALVSAIAAMMLTACSPLTTNPLGAAATPNANHIAASASEAIACQQLLDRSILGETSLLDSSDISLLNWNIQKGQQNGWQSDLQQLADNTQLVLIQEAALAPELVKASKRASFWSFAPGYKTDTAQTGVLTLSSVEPITHCNLTAWEPWLRTPKATSITEYGLTDSNDTLVVVNIHALNFTIGVKEYTRQMKKIETALRNHTGPIVLSGDFNSWRVAREARLQNLVDNLGLAALHYEVDNRTQVFGRPIDHIYVRGLEVRNSESHAVSSSDHNPMRVSLALLTQVADYDAENNCTRPATQSDATVNTLTC